MIQIDCAGDPRTDDTTRAASGGGGRLPTEVAKFLDEIAEVRLFTRPLRIVVKPAIRAFVKSALAVVEGSAQTEDLLRLLPSAKADVDRERESAVAGGQQLAPHTAYDWERVLPEQRDRILQWVNVDVDSTANNPVVENNAALSLVANDVATTRSAAPESSESTLFVAAASIQVPADDDRWLIDDLLARQSVAVIGGDPKLGKSWLASHLAVAVASGQPCLAEFTARQTGTVLLCSGEGPIWMATDRLQNACRHSGLDLASLPIHVMAERLVRLDIEADQDRLRAEVERYTPIMLIIDPLVSFHQSDENAAGGLAPVLQFLDALRRAYGTSIVLVHHTSKRAGGRGGKRLRGSGALHAWADSGLYLEERKGVVTLTLEQRTGASRAQLALELVGDGTCHHLKISELPVYSGSGSDDDTEADLKDRILGVLATEESPISREQLRKAIGVKNERLTAPLSALKAEGRIVRESGGIALAVPVPTP